MKSLFILLFPALLFSQSKDFTKKEILKNKRVIEYAKIYETKPENVYNFLKCMKNLSEIKQFKKLPFFTGKLISSCKKCSKDEENMTWDIIGIQCKEQYIFNLGVYENYKNN